MNPVPSDNALRVFAYSSPGLGDQRDEQGALVSTSEQADTEHLWRRGPLFSTARPWIGAGPFVMSGTSKSEVLASQGGTFLGGGPSVP